MTATATPDSAAIPADVNVIDKPSTPLVADGVVDVNGEPDRYPFTFTSARTMPPDSGRPGTFHNPALCGMIKAMSRSFKGETHT